MATYDYAWFFLCMAGTDIIGDNWLKIIHGRRKAEKNFRLGGPLGFPNKVCDNPSSYDVFIPP